MKSRLLLFSTAAITAPSLVFATLGGDFSSVQGDQAFMKGTLRTARTETNYSVHEIQTPSGILVREFVAANGTVFGVAWNGPVIPNLRQLLGQYFDPYVKSARVRRTGHSQLLVEQPDFVAHSSGHMRAFSGNAYVPQKLPQGVTPSEIF